MTKPQENPSEIKQTYDNLSEFVGPLKRAAIDAYMASQVDWTDHYEIEDGMYVGRSMLYNKEAYVTCPDTSTGLGGGETYLKKYGERRDPDYKPEVTLYV